LKNYFSSIFRLEDFMKDFYNELTHCIAGEVRFDKISKIAYSVDASIYEVEPIGIVLPKNKADLTNTIKIAAAYQVPIIPRGAATGITGGCLGKGLIVDTSKYLNNILEINFEENYALCEAGVVQDQLNKALSSKGYRLGPDTSTGNRATLGGMTANNAAGARSLRYGKMVDHVLSIELALANGKMLEFSALDETALQCKLQQQDQEGDLYREMVRIRETYRHEIQSKFPNIPRRASGYNLDELIKPGPFNACKLITGSEGTLGVFHTIKVGICKKPAATALCVIHFSDMLKAMQTIPEILAFHPLAFEMIDDQILTMGRLSPVMQHKLQWLQGKPACIFAVEFDADSKEEATQKAIGLQQFLTQKQIGYARIVLDDPVSTSHLWEVRKAGLGLLLSRRTYSRAIAFIEDLSVAPAQLYSFMSKFCAYLKSKGKEAGIYGHVGSGCMHVRPYINLRDSQDAALMHQMILDVSDLVLEHGGSLSGEHGDGLIRSWLNKKMFGEKIYRAFEELKSAFDPTHQMNPGKIVDGPPLLNNLRTSPETKGASIKTFLDFSKEGGFELAADLCNGNGLCRKKESLMCPSFQATGSEYDTTRARAQSLRAIINGRLPLEEFAGKGLYDVLDLCLECKGCKTECPSQVDMAKMKAEFLYQYQEKHGYSLRNLLFANIGRLNRLSSAFPSLFNYISSSSLSKKMLHWMGIAQERTLPLIANKRFSSWFKKHTQPSGLKRQIVLFNDTFTEFNQPEIGKAAVHILNALGYQVLVPPWHCCGRPMISKGLLPRARKKAEDLIEILYPFANQGLAIVGLEPSCILTLKDDVESLLPSNSKVKTVVNACVTLDEFLSKEKLPFKAAHQEKTIKLHGHCHQKALCGMQPTLQVLKAIPQAHVSEIESGCCGMAGSFGYEKEHYALSMKIGELRLMPAIRAGSEHDLIVANGFSCRTQIAHATGKQAKHLAEVVADFF
jgi:FAD/FMN-containing dehydrogenase/Fe-S oxidoreductase